MGRDVLWEKDSSAGRRYYCWYYYAKRDDLGNRFFPVQLHKVRDAFALHLLGEAFRDFGYRYGGAVLNVPGDKGFEVRAGKTIDVVAPGTVRYGAGDLLVLGTRPPLDDLQKSRKGVRPIDRSGYGSEKLLHEELRRLFFSKCDRSQIDLREDLACDPPEATIFRSLIFDVNAGGKIARCGGHAQAPWKSAIPPPDSRCSTGYLLSMPSWGGHHLRVLGAFSSGGAETLWWVWSLVNHRRALLERALNEPHPRLWQGFFSLPERVPAFFQHEDQKLDIIHRKSDAPWPDIIEWTPAA